MERFQLAPLPYAYDALAPILSEETLRLHHDAHHAGYVKKLNELIVGSEFMDSSLEKIIQYAGTPLFEQAAQHWNHDFYWKSLSPKKNQKPKGDLLAAIEKRYSTWEKFQAEFQKKGEGQFGSGWVWLVQESNAELNIVATHDADNPIRHGQRPLLNCDVWEHAYYVDYRNKRADYLEKFWTIANWEFAEANYRKGVEIVNHAQQNAMM